MSPVSLVFEYWSALVYQVNQPLVVSAICSRSSLSVKALLPTMLMLLDAGDVAFVDVERDVDAIALDRRHGGGDLDAVQAVRQVLALEFLLGAVDRGLVEDLGLADADFLERLDQHVLVEFLGAGEVDRGDRRPLFDQHHQHVVFLFQPDVLEKAGGVQRLDRGDALFIVEGIADLAPADS